ncbi:hypothetical protein QOT17_009741 [Balamuthia mandrillaris]
MMMTESDSAVSAEGSLLSSSPFGGFSSSSSSSSSSSQRGASTGSKTTVNAHPRHLTPSSSAALSPPSSASSSTPSPSAAVVPSLQQQQEDEDDLLLLSMFQSEGEQWQLSASLTDKLSFLRSLGINSIPSLEEMERQLQLYSFLQPLLTMLTPAQVETQLRRWKNTRHVGSAEQNKTKLATIFRKVIDWCHSAAFSREGLVTRLTVFGLSSSGDISTMITRLITRAILAPSDDEASDLPSSVPSPSFSCPSSTSSTFTLPSAVSMGDANDATFKTPLPPSPHTMKRSPSRSDRRHKSSSAAPLLLSFQQHERKPEYSNSFEDASSNSSNSSRGDPRRLNVPLLLPRNPSSPSQLAYPSANSDISSPSASSSLAVPVPPVYLLSRSSTSSSSSASHNTLSPLSCTPPSSPTPDVILYADKWTVPTKHFCLFGISDATPFSPFSPAFAFPSSYRSKVVSAFPSSASTSASASSPSASASLSPTSHSFSSGKTRKVSSPSSSPSYSPPTSQRSNHTPENNQSYQQKNTDPSSSTPLPSSSSKVRSPLPIICSLGNDNNLASSSSFLAGPRDASSVTPSTPERGEEEEQAASLMLLACSVVTTEPFFHGDTTTTKKRKRKRVSTAAVDDAQLIKTTINKKHQRKRPRSNSATNVKSTAQQRKRLEASEGVKDTEPAAPHSPNNKPHSPRKRRGGQQARSLDSRRKTGALSGGDTAADLLAYLASSSSRRKE